MQKSDVFALSAIAALVVAVIASTTWFLLIKKEYDFNLEAVCDPSVQTCFERDCSIADECPPNNLADYREFKVRASDFSSCKDNSCLEECLNGTIPCTETLCGEDGEDTCSEPPASTEATTTENE